MIYFFMQNTKEDIKKWREANLNNNNNKYFSFLLFLKLFLVHYSVL